MLLVFVLYPTQNVNWEDVKKKAVFTPNLPELDDNIDAGTEFRFNTDQKTRSCKPGRSFKVGYQQFARLFISLCGS
jgi:hypothetical protein